MAHEEDRDDAIDVLLSLTTGNKAARGGNSGNGATAATTSASVTTRGSAGRGGGTVMVSAWQAAAAYQQSVDSVIRNSSKRRALAGASDMPNWSLDTALADTLDDDDDAGAYVDDVNDAEYTATRSRNLAPAPTLQRGAVTTQQRLLSATPTTGAATLARRSSDSVLLPPSFATPAPKKRAVVSLACPQCGTRFGRTHHLERHVVEQHSRRPNGVYVCEPCNIEFP